MNPAAKVAQACCHAELQRELVKAWTRTLDGIHVSLLQCLLQNVGIAAIDQWEKERPERERDEFFGPAKEPPQSLPTSAKSKKIRRKGSGGAL
jgi:hypothetical protein